MSDQHTKTPLPMVERRRKVVISYQGLGPSKMKRGENGN